MKRFSLIVLLAVIMAVLALSNMGCGRNTEPAWVADLIEEFKNQPVANPPQSIWQCVYEGQIVYVVEGWGASAYVYDCELNYVCQPLGGVTGWGDGKCRDFFDKCTDAKLIWKGYP